MTARISPAMRYFYAASAMGIPHANFAPSLANVPALYELAIQNGVPYAGMDGKTGQTLVKTALASMFRARRIGVTRGAPPRTCVSCDRSGVVVPGP